MVNFAWGFGLGCFIMLYLLSEKFRKELNNGMIRFYKFLQSLEFRKQEKPFISAKDDKPTNKEDKDQED